MAVWVSGLFFVMMGNWCITLRLTTLDSCMSDAVGEVGYLWFCFGSQGCSRMIESRASWSRTWWLHCVVIITFLVYFGVSFDFLFIRHASDGHRNFGPKLKPISFGFTRTVFLNSRVDAGQSHTLTTLTRNNHITFDPFSHNALLLQRHTLVLALLIFDILRKFDLIVACLWLWLDGMGVGWPQLCYFLMIIVGFLPVLADDFGVELVALE